MSVSQAGWDFTLTCGQEIRLLLTLAKFTQLKGDIVPPLVVKVGKLLEVDVHKDQALLDEVLQNMDDMVLRDYVRRRALPLTTMIEDGILRGGIDWLNAEKPTGQSLSRLITRVLTDCRGPAIHAPCPPPAGRCPLQGVQRLA